MTVEDLENLPDGIVPSVSKSVRQRAEELYADMYCIIRDRQDAIDCARLSAERLARETNDNSWDKVAQEIKRLS